MMMMTMKHALRNGATRVMLIGVVAICMGAALAVVAPLVHVTPTAVAATNHCTRFAPAISQDVNCNLSGTMYDSGVGTYQTPSTALRDSDAISMAASRQWELSYYGGNGASGTGIGTSGSIGSSNGYAAAQCWLWYQQPSVTGHCVTDWHD